MNLAALIPVSGEGPEIVARSVGSALGQSVPPDAVHVLASGPVASDTLRTLDRLAEQHPSLAIHRQPVRLSAGEARNRLIAQADGARHLAFLDGDDEWLPNHLLRGLDAIATAPTDGAVLFSAPYRIRQTGRIVRPDGARPSLARLSRQPLLLSSVIVRDLPANLRFRDMRGEDFVFVAELGRRATAAVTTREVAAIYDLGNWRAKGFAFKARRNWRMFRALTATRSHAGALWLNFAVAYALRATLR